MQNRRDFLKVMTGAASALAVPSLAGAAEAKERPNIVYILADDMGYGDLNCQNPESKIPTPNLDRLATGFDYYFGDDVPNFPPYVFIENDRTVGIPSAKKPKGMFGAGGPMLPGWELDDVMPTIADKALEYIDDEAGKDDPFFLFFTLTAPHTPIVPLEKFEGKSEAGRYGDYVYQVDHSVGEIMRTLKQRGLDKDTLLIFTSDNGSPGRDGTNDGGGKQSVVRRYGHDPSGKWKGQKGDIWEAGHRVPFIVRWPGHVSAATVNDEIICQVDLMVTLAGMLGIDLPSDAAPDSYNILSLFEGAEPDNPIREATVHHSHHGLFAIRQGKWKLIDGLGAGGFSGLIRKPKEGEPPGQLYNLEADPGEQNNLYAQHPEVVQQLKSLLEKYKRDGRSVQP